MRAILIILLASSFLVAGCDFQQIKDAASDINNAANNASTATSEEVHSIRALEITYNNKTFTVNDLYKGILRDVFWHYESNETEQILTVKGTWQPGLLESSGLTLTQYPELDVEGEVVVKLIVRDGKIVEEKTNVTVSYEKKILLNETGSTILQQLYEAYSK